MFACCMFAIHFVSCLPIKNKFGNVVEHRPELVVSNVW